MPGPGTRTKLVTLCLMALLLSGWLHEAMGQGTDWWRHMLHTEALLDTAPFRAVHFSSYARNGGNSDMGEYYGQDAYGWKILCDVSGPGVVVDFWCTRQPMLASSRLRVFVDDTTAAVIDTPFVAFFGHMFPFMAPLADSSSGAYYCYVPIPFQNRIRITYSGQSIYYHVTALAFPSGTEIESFRVPPSFDYLARLDSLRSRFTDSLQGTAWPDRSATPQTASETFSAGETRDLLTYSGAGGCRSLVLRTGDHNPAALDSLWIRIYTDHNPFAGLEGPFSTFFGTARGWYPYRSAFTSVCGDSLYLILPIPFTAQFRLEISNQSSAPQTIQADAQFVTLPAGEVPRFRTYAICNDGNPTVQWEGFDIASIKGPGTFLGTLLDIEAPDSHVVEGDEHIFIDHEVEPSWRGTGTEDYFNAGYYWNDGEGYAALGFHGCIHYAGVSVATYRWHIPDPVPFTNHFRMNMEVGGWNQLTGHYRSVSFFFAARSRWHAVAASGNSWTMPGEELRITGVGLPPGEELAAVHMSNTLLERTGGTPFVNADSIVDVIVRAPSGSQSGYLPLSVLLGSTTEVIDSAWLHYSQPLLSYVPNRVDLDSSLFAGDSLAVNLQGITPGATASIYGDDMLLFWTGTAPLADAHGHLRGMVTLPPNLSPGDYTMRAQVAGLMDVSCAQPLRVRSYVRFEIEDLPVTAIQARYRMISYAPDWEAPGSTEPWGRDLAYEIVGNGPGDHIDKTFSLPSAGVFQTVYFFARTNTGAILRTTIDDSTDLEAYDSYFGPIDWRWVRSDTVRGRVQALAAGLHQIRFEIISRNPSSQGWRMIADQMLLMAPVSDSMCPPSPVRDLVVAADPDGVRLRWSPVQSDTVGRPLTPSSYTIFKSPGWGSPWEVCGQASGTDTTFLDTNFVSMPLAAICYYVVANSGELRHSPSLPASQLSPPASRDVRRKK